MLLVFITILKLIWVKKRREKIDYLKNQTSKIYSQYSYSVWYQTFLNLWLPNSILIVNDYGANLGWIETLLWEITQQLSMNHTINHLYGTIQKYGLFWRYLWLIKTFGNLWASIRLIKKQNSAQLIRRHSVHRQLGRLPVLWSSSVPKHRLMVHDMGLIHPFPSHVTQESQLTISQTLWGWINEWVKAKWRLRSPLILIKRIGVQLIRSCIRAKKMLIQVPSTYLQWYVQYRAWSCEVVVVSHFVLSNTHAKNSM